MSYTPRGGQTIAYLPTLEDINAECDRIRSQWSDDEREARWLVAHSVCNLGDIPGRYDDLRRRRSKRPRMTAQQLRVVDFCVG